MVLPIKIIKNNAWKEYEDFAPAPFDSKRKIVGFKTHSVWLL